MEFNDETTFDASPDVHGADPPGAEHDSALGDTRHYDMMPNDGTSKPMKSTRLKNKNNSKKMRP